MAKKVTMKKEEVKAQKPTMTRRAVRAKKQQEAQQQEERIHVSSADLNTPDGQQKMMEMVKQILPIVNVKVEEDGTLNYAPSKDLFIQLGALCQTIGYYIHLAKQVFNPDDKDGLEKFVLAKLGTLQNTGANVNFTEFIRIEG